MWYSSAVQSGFGLPYSNTYIVLKNYYYDELGWKSATSGVLKTLGDQARQNKEDRLFLDFPSVYKKLESGRYAFPYVSIVNIVFIME